MREPAANFNVCTLVKYIGSVVIAEIRWFVDARGTAQGIYDRLIFSKISALVRSFTGIFQWY